MHLLHRSLAGIALAICASVSVFVSQPARAALLANDVVPASTLLFPYFEVDMNSAAGTTDSLLTVQNSSATAMLVHVSVWSDQGVLAAGFNIYLTGYDVQALSMRDVIGGTLPRTASAGQDPSDTISPKGSYSQDINFASCGGLLPPANGAYTEPTGMTPANLRLALTGQATSGISSGQCWGNATGDNHARGYVTMDTVNYCTPGGPSSSGYMTNTITVQNVLNGSYIISNPSTNFVLADAAVQIEASSGGTYPVDPNGPAVVTAGNYTFYGRYDSTPWNAEDQREPLPSSWLVQGETGTTALAVWRDSKTVESPHACGSTPAYYPLGQEGLEFFGTDSNFDLTFAPTTPLPSASQFVAFNATSFGAPAKKLGLLYTDLNTTVTAAGSNPPADPAASQSYVVISRQGQAGLPTSSAHAAIAKSRAESHIVP